MIRVKRKANKKIIVSLFLLAAFVLLLTSTILMNIFGGQSSGGSSTSKPPLEVLPGESVYGSYNVAYPYIDDGALMHISVSDKANSFKLIRPDENGDMVLYYTGKNGATEVYYPNILASDENVAYSALYAIEGADGMGMIPLVSYLCSAVGFTAFQDRIALSTDPTVRAAQLSSFGFTVNEYVTVGISYTVKGENEGDEPTTEEHTIKIGKKTVTGAGRYFMVDDREYIYCSAHDYMEYGLQGYAAFIKPYIVTEGMRGDDSVLAAYLTQDFREWKNTIHSNLGDVVTSGAQVIVDAQAITPSDPLGSFNAAAGDNIDGYRHAAYEKTSFYLDGLEKDPAYSRLLTALIGKGVGQYYDYMDPYAEDNSIIFTLTSQSKTIDFGTSTVVKYEYTIHHIESILTDTDECSVEGTPVGDAKLLKIAYSLKVDGVQIGKYLNHAVVDLTDDRIPAGTRAALAESSVGELKTPIEFWVDYTEDNATRYDVEYVICDILEIYDKNGKEIVEVADDSSVVYRYYLVVNGERDDDVHVGTVSFADPDNEDEDTKSLRAALVGKRTSADIELKVMTYTEYSEMLYDFITYKVAEIEYFVTSELVTAFGFINASQRDPFYGESFYANKMDGENNLYGINADACISIVKYFMGVSNDSSASTDAEGLVGQKTVAIGLTPENMEKYGLYAYTLYIELPRGIYPLNDENYENENALDNYDWRDTLSFYIFISEEQYDGTRYIASDMYDLVTTVDADMFDFLEYDFAEFWARRSLLLTDFKNIENMKFEFNMDDLYGSYNLDIVHQILYVDENGQSYVSEPEDIYTDVYNVSHINVSQFGDCITTEFSKFLASKGIDTTSLTVLYNNLKGDGSTNLMGNRDTLGSANYKNFMHLVYGIYYTDYLSDLTEDKKDEIKKSEPLMKMSVTLESQPYSYTYEFHKVDDRRIMVTLYRADSAGDPTSEAVSDFYLSSFAFKKIVRGFFDVLNGNNVDSEVGYPKED